MNLFECQTCETSYHASCMSPTTGNEDVPSFWFCPHCVDRQMHIPSDEAMAQISEVAAISAPPAHVPTSAASTISTERGIHHTSAKAQASVSSTNANDSSTLHRSEGQMISVAASKKKIHDMTRNLNSAASDTRRITDTSTTKKSADRPLPTYSPPRKRSKYSAFSSHVDKALAVIHKELESAAQMEKTENSLRDRIQTLEQELRLKDGQVLLANRELEIARKNGDAVTLRSEIKQLREQNDGLKALVESKDGELQDWRTKLKNLLGEATS